MSKYALDNYDRVYLISMSSCLTSLVEDRHLAKISLITPFYLYTKPICQLLKSSIIDFFGCHILMAFSGRMGLFDQRLKIILTEIDNITDNKYFYKRFKNVKTIKGLEHSLEEYGALKIIKNDLSEDTISTTL